MNVIKQTRITAAETGEVLYDDEREVRFYLWSDPGGFMIYNNRRAVKVFVFNELPITANEMGKIMQLMPHINKNNAIVQIDSGFAMTTPMIAKVFGCSAYAWLRRMLKVGIVRKHEGVYYLNPKYLLGGNRISKELYHIFADQLQDEIPAWVKRKMNE